MATRTWRPFFVALHRYVGLAIAVFVFIAAATGAVLAYRAQIDAWLMPPDPALLAHRGPILDGFAVREIVERRYPNAVMPYVDLRPPPPGRPYTAYLEPRIDPATGEPLELAIERVQVHPVTGVVLSEGRAGHPIDFSPEGLTATLVDLHFRLWLPDEAGRLIMGIAAMLWFFDHAWGLVLAFPSLAGWRKAFALKLRGDTYKVTFSLHRAGAVWLWLALVAVACSSFAYNLEPVFRGMVGAVLPLSGPPAAEQRAPLPRPVPDPPIAFEDAFRRLKSEIDARAARDGFEVRFLQYIAYDRATGVYRVQLNTTRDIRREFGRTVVYLDALDGRVLGWKEPQGSTAGDWFVALQDPLHVGDLAAVPRWLHQLLLCATGVVTAMLTVTGVYLWARKRRARRAPRGAALTTRG